MFYYLLTGFLLAMWYWVQYCLDDEKIDLFEIAVAVLIMFCWLPLVVIAIVLRLLGIEIPSEQKEG